MDQTKMNQSKTEQTANPVSQGKYTDAIYGTALGWAGKNPRSSTTMTIELHSGWSLVRKVRIFSTMRGNLSPITEQDLEQLCKELGMLDNPSYTITVNWGGAK